MKPAQKDMRWREAIELVLRKASKPLTANEISDLIIEEKLRESLGATPYSTVAANINTSIKDNGDKSPFVRVDKGLFALREALSQPTPTTTTNLEADIPEEEEQYEVFTSFGMYWQRHLISWNRTPRILGKQQLESEAVNFHDQLGIYLLYDGREVIYVGRSAKRPIGTRLYEHTVDRLSSRWDRFSWFGLKPISEAGKLGNMPPSYDSSSLIPALEAILIEALEPRQNRKRGDDLAAVEYMQAEDPELRKEQILKEVAEALKSKST